MILKKYLIILIILIAVPTVLSCWLNECDCFYLDQYYSINCNYNQLISFSNESINDRLIFLKLKGVDNFEFFIKNKEKFNNIKLFKLEITNIKDNLDMYLDKINSLKSLKDLKLSNNKIHFFKITKFNRLINLIKLDLSYNELINFKKEENIGYGLDNLKEYNLSHNLLSEIENGDFDSLSELEILDLSYNNK